MGKAWRPRQTFPLTTIYTDERGIAAPKSPEGRLEGGLPLANLRGINPGFALDHMEPMRPVVDRAVLQLIDTATFTGADFSIQHDGGCRMNPDLARRVAQLTLERCGPASG